MTKSDLKDGMRIKYKYCDSYHIIIGQKAYVLDSNLARGAHMDLCGLDNLLKDSDDEEYNVVRIEDVLGKLLWERKETKEMTLEQICEALGKDIKIIK